MSELKLIRQQIDRFNRSSCCQVVGFFSCRFVCNSSIFHCFFLRWRHWPAWVSKHFGSILSRFASLVHPFKSVFTVTKTCLYIFRKPQTYAMHIIRSSIFCWMYRVIRKKNMKNAEFLAAMNFKLLYCYFANILKNIDDGIYFVADSWLTLSMSAEIRVSHSSLAQCPSRLKYEPIMAAFDLWK